MDHVITADKTEDIEVHSKWLDWTWLWANSSSNPRTESSQPPLRSSRLRSLGSLMPMFCSASSRRWQRTSPRNTGHSPHRESWLPEPWSSFSLGCAAGRNAARETRCRPTQRHRHCQHHCFSTGPGT
jgi:hypothetical protein